LSKFFKAY